MSDQQTTAREIEVRIRTVGSHDIMPERMYLMTCEVSGLLEELQQFKPRGWPDTSVHQSLHEELAILPRIFPASNLGTERCSIATAQTPSVLGERIDCRIQVRFEEGLDLLGETTLA